MLVDPAAGHRPALRCLGNTPARLRRDESATTSWRALPSRVFNALEEFGAGCIATESKSGGGPHALQDAGASGYALNAIYAISANNAFSAFYANSAINAINAINAFYAINASRGGKEGWIIGSMIKDEFRLRCDGKTQSRTGKIARLPYNIREEVNRRLRDNVPGGKICEWLNRLPAAMAVCAEFARRNGKEASPINEKQLSEWRRGGFRDWLREQAVLEDTREMTQWSMKLAKDSGGELSEGAAVLLSAQLLKVLQGMAIVGKVQSPKSKVIRLRIADCGMALTPALSHPMGEGEVVPALGWGNPGLTVHIAADRNVRGPGRWTGWNRVCGFWHCW